MSRTKREADRITCATCGELLTIYNSRYYGIHRGAHCKSCHTKREKERRAGIPNKIREIHLRGTYGISLEEYETLMKLQNGKCAICENKDTQSLCVDHNHETNQIRGLLCKKCNSAIGLLNEDLDLIERMRNYLLKYKDLPEMK